MLRFAIGSIALVAIAWSIGVPIRRGDVPLWPGARYTVADRDRALEHGLSFLYSKAREPRVFETYGADLLFAFWAISDTSLDPVIARTAWRMGRERSSAWRRAHSRVPPQTNADEIADMVFADDVSTRFGVRGAIYEQLRERAKTFPAEDYLWFDPRREAPPSDIPKACRRCERQNARGATTCKWDGEPLRVRSRYDVYLDALVTSFGGDRSGITLGAPFKDVIRWLPTLRPYPAGNRQEDSEYRRAVYAATHIVYTVNGYSERKIPPGCLVPEFDYLKANMREAMGENDPETMGEYLDSLRAFGLTASDPLLRAGIESVLAAQHADGSWGDTSDAYTWYHSTWTAIDGLREYRWRGFAECPEPRTASTSTQGR
jgi:hypothetical protein